MVPWRDKSPLGYIQLKFLQITFAGQVTLSFGRIMSRYKASQIKDIQLTYNDQHMQNVSVLRELMKSNIKLHEDDVIVWWFVKHYYVIQYVNY